jgi:hypothetical protein
MSCFLCGVVILNELSIEIYNRVSYMRANHTISKNLPIPLETLFINYREIVTEMSQL